MSEVVKININFDPSLTKPEKEIVESSRTNRVFQLSNEELENTLLDSLIQSASVIGNKSMQSEDFKLMRNQLIDYLKSNHKYSAIGEVQQAIKLGSFGSYLKEKDVLFLSVANIAKWIRTYEEEKRITLSKQAEFEKKQRENEEEMEKQSQSAKKYWDDLPKNIANCPKDSKMASNYFRDLWNLKLLRLEKEEIEATTRESRKEVESKLRSDRIPLKTIGEKVLMSMTKKRSAEKCFFIWLEENENNDIEKIVREAIKKKL